MNKVVKLTTVDEVNKQYDLETIHPKISVFNLSDI